MDINTATATQYNITRAFREMRSLSRLRKDLADHVVTVDAVMEELCKHTEQRDPPRPFGPLLHFAGLPVESFPTTREARERARELKKAGLNVILALP